MRGNSLWLALLCVSFAHAHVTRLVVEKRDSPAFNGQSFGAAGPIFYLEMFDRLMRMVIVLSAPLIVAMFLAEFALALVSRFAPQLQVFFLAMPIKSGVNRFVRNPIHMMNGNNT